MLLKLRDVWFEYPGETVLRGMHLTLSEGDTLAVIGPSGMGKTTLLKIMSGLLQPTKGEVSFRNADLGRLKYAQRSFILRRIGMTFQKSGLFDSMTVFENLDFPLRELTKLGVGDRERKISSALEEVGLNGYQSLQVHEMSGGMQKRLCIARALVLNPELILFDDPTAGLDPITAKAINDLILTMRKKYQMTYVVVTSDPIQAYQLAEKVGFLYKGDFVALGSAQEIQDSKNAYVRQFVHGELEGPLTMEDA